jgi:hypothetical protein
MWQHLVTLKFLEFTKGNFQPVAEFFQQNIGPYEATDPVIAWEPTYQ